MYARGKPRGIESVTARQSAYTASRTSPPRDSQLESGAAQDGRRRTGSSIGCPLPLRYTHRRLCYRNGHTDNSTNAPLSIEYGIEI